MLILFKSSIKISLLLLLLTAGGTYLMAGNSTGKNRTRNPQPDRVYLIVNDTITNGEIEINQEVKFIIPAYASGKNFDFQVNSDISYFSFGHFVNDESKKLFFQAWLEEIEAKRLSARTDSLRKAYVNTSSEQKDSVSALILKAEERLIELNVNIPVLYGKAREKEIEYWQSASADETAKFQKKIKLFKDSIQQISDLHSRQTANINQKNQDTITFYKSSPKAVIETDETSGIIYKIQIGAYKGKVPPTAIKSIKKISILRKVENYKDGNGITIYATGNLKRYQEAVIMQNQVKQEGIKNAAIIAFQKGKKITVNEARKLNDEL